jgi:hypothetical protein
MTNEKSKMENVPCYNGRRPPSQPRSPGSEKPLSQNVTDCPRCSRRTPAARGECIYCGESLPIANIETAPPQRNIDPGDHAFNTVLEPFPAHFTESAAVALASALQIELSDAQALVGAGKAVPLARSQTRPEAEMIAALVRTCGLRATVIPDEDLKLKHELLRARRVSLCDDELRVHHSGVETTIKKAEIRLLVLGELSNRRVDYTERISGRQGQSGNVLDTSEYRSEETLLDIYTASLDRSLRIKSDAFDYSGLVSLLSFRSDENFRAALTTLRAILPRAKVDDDFAKVRGLLERAWPERSHNESRGIKRTGIAFRAVAQSSVVSDNRDQFDRYSRLMFSLIDMRRD